MSGTMHVAVYHNNRDVRIEERPVPRIGPRELLLKVHASGICGSDLLEWYRVPKAPVVLGHEIGAEVADVGSEVQGWRRGDRLFASHHVPCGECAHCTAGHETVCERLRKTNFDPGGFAEFVRLSEPHLRNGVFRIPDPLSYEEATFIEPLACAVRGQRAAKLKSGQTVLVLGSGVAGLLHIRLAVRTGARRVWATDLVENRLSAARNSGAIPIRASEEIGPKLRESNDNRLADLVVTCTGATGAIDLALQAVEPGGTVLFFAPTNPGVIIPMPFNDLWRNEITTTSTYGAAPRDIRESIALLADQFEVRDLITHRLPLSEAGEGFGLAADSSRSIKVVLFPSSTRKALEASSQSVRDEHAETE